MPEGEVGTYTPMVIARVREACLAVCEVQTLEALDAFASQVREEDSKVGLILSCGSSVWLTDLLDIEAYMACCLTTAAMLHFPNAPVVGICFGMQLLALYGGKLVDSRSTGHAPGSWKTFRRTTNFSRLLEGLGPNQTQWATNSVFVHQLPPDFVPTLVDASGRPMAMEHKLEHIYGFQFHPEMVDRDGYAGSIPFQRIVGLCGQDRRTTRWPLGAEFLSPWHWAARPRAAEGPCGLRKYARQRRLHHRGRPSRRWLRTLLAGRRRPFWAGGRHQGLATCVDALAVQQSY